MINSGFNAQWSVYVITVQCIIYLGKGENSPLFDDGYMTVQSSPSKLNNEALHSSHQKNNPTCILHTGLTVTAL